MSFPSVSNIPWYRLPLLCGGLCLLLLSTLQACNCGGEVTVNLPGCEDCPGRCLRINSNLGKCVACLNDEQCQSADSPTRKCIANKCTCNTDPDCPQGQVCSGDAAKGKDGCVECTKNEDCSRFGKGLPVCLFNECTACEPSSIRGCAPSDLPICVKGTQTCDKAGQWGKCEGWKQCTQCTTTPVCAIGEKKCTTAAGEKPGKYLLCVQGDDGCTTWDKEEKSCGDERTCENNECQPTNCPAPECTLGETRCDGTTHMQTCGRDSKDCVVWLPKAACGASETCKDKRCAPACTPATETCNNKDDDCDGSIDEDFTDLNTPCSAGQGACKSDGMKICANDGKGTACSATAGTPSAEICNGQDDDCDGQTDEGLTCAKPEPGCADGTRELFTDMQKWPLIAGCKGYYRGESLRKDRTNTSGCGDSENNACQSAEDLCANGWHICLKNGDPKDLSSRTSSSDCASNGAGLFVAASSHCTQNQPTCSYGTGALVCTQGGPCSEPVCCGKGCDYGQCKSGVWPNQTRCARPKSFIGCGNANSFHGNPTITGILCCKDNP